jgi:hypothetical protein
VRDIDLLEDGVRNIFRIILGFWLCGLLMAAHADTIPLADGTSLTGDIISFNDAGVIFRLADSKYSDRIAWTKFSQEGLKQLANNPKISPMVEPFIEIPLSDRPQKPEIKINDVTRLEVPPKQSLLGALLSSSVGIFVLLLIYGANIYAGYEIAVVRARSKGLVMGVAAVLPILGPIIFLAMPMQAEVVPVEEIVESSKPPGSTVPGEPASSQEEIQVTAVTAGSAPAPKTAGQVFKRGQFTFNRRFIESKFGGYLAEVRSAADADTTLIVKTTTSQTVVERIVNLGANEMQVEVMLGETRQQATITFADIQEIQIKPNV